jgi:hypothetical protein
MLQKLGPHIAECLERAVHCKRRASETENLESRREFLDLERTWTHLARSYEFVESLERFLLDGAKYRPGERADDPARPDHG